MTRHLQNLKFDATGDNKAREGYTCNDAKKAHTRDAPVKLKDNIPILLLEPLVIIRH